MPIRNEDWIIGLSLRAALLWMDQLVVLNHNSTDRTGELLDELRGEYGERLECIESNDPVWHEMSHRQMLLEAARAMGATHIATVDADEVLVGDALPVIKDEIRELKPGEVLQLRWAHCWRGIERWRVDRGWDNKWASTAFRDAPQIHWKPRNGYDHHHRHPFEYTGLKQVLPASGLMHLQHSVWRRLLAKQALYKMWERTRWPDRESVTEVDRKYSETVDERGAALRQIPRDWWAPYQQWMEHLDLSDRTPWQEVECHRLRNKHGAETFAGLDLFGIC